MYDLETYSQKQLNLLAKRVKREYARGSITRERMVDLLDKIDALKKELSWNEKHRDEN